MYRATLTLESTPQEVYDHIKAAAKAGSFPSYNEIRNTCQYRYKDRACVAGIFIADDKYMECFDSQKNIPNNLLSINANAVFEFIGGYPKFLFNEFEGVTLIQSLQKCHDNEAMTGTFNLNNMIIHIKKTFGKYGFIVAD